MIHRDVFTNVISPQCCCLHLHCTAAIHRTAREDVSTVGITHPEAAGVGTEGESRGEGQAGEGVCGLPLAY